VIGNATHHPIVRGLALGLLGLWLMALPVAHAQEEPPPPDVPVSEETPEVVDDAGEEEETTVPPTAPPASPAPPTSTPTATPDVPEFVYAWSVEVIYPAGVRFVLTLARPVAQINQLTLTIQPPDQPARTVSVSPSGAAVLATESFTDLVYIWQMPLDDPLPFLEIVDYNWLAVVDGGQSASIPGAFLYADPAIDWIRADDPDEMLSLIYPAGRLNPAGVRGELRGAYEQLADNLDECPHFRLALYDEHFPLDPCQPAADEDERRIAVGPQSGTVIDCPPGIMEAVLAGIDYLPLRGSTTLGSALTQSLLRYMVDEFYAPVWAGRDVPAWFQTGLAYFYMPVDKRAMIETTRSAARVNRVYSLSQMRAPDPDNLGLWEAQSYSMVLYIADRIGVPALFELAQTAGAGESFAGSYEAVSGQPLASLLPAWRNWIYSGVAVAAASLDLYSGPTPSATTGPTRTPFPPTSTSTPTSTPTDTPTPTVTGFLSATPLPTRTPTDTLTPAPPTVTPRPAAMLNLATATPTPPPGGLGGLPVQTDVLALAGVVAIFAVVAGVIAALFRKK
jgi:hypothetical protein